MELGEKLKQARLEAGLSQRQLCGGEITRNMLSQIEHGTARPSMDTLRYLSARLGKPLSWFLEEDAVMSSNQPVMEAARSAFDAGEYPAACTALDAYRAPDPIFDRERGLLLALSLMGAAEEAGAQGRDLYALDLLEQARQAGEGNPYYTPELERRRLLLLARMKKQAADVCALLPSLDEELMLRAQAALEAGDTFRAGALLDAAREQSAPRWNLLRGQTYRLTGDNASAARCLRLAEDAFPQDAAPLLEQCYRDLGDFKQAYYYACKQK